MFIFSWFYNFGSFCRSAVYNLYALFHTRKCYVALGDFYTRIERVAKHKLPKRVVEIGPATGMNSIYILPFLTGNNIEYNAVEYDMQYSDALESNMWYGNNKFRLGPKDGDFMNCDLDYFKPVDGVPVHVWMIECIMLIKPEDKMWERIKQIRTTYPETVFIFSQCMFNKRSLFGRLASLLKPLMFYTTSIDFGTPVYLQDFLERVRTIFGEDAHLIKDEHPGITVDLTTLNNHLKFYAVSAETRYPEENAAAATA